MTTYEIIRPLLHTLLTCAAGVRVELDRYTNPKPIDRALANIEDGMGGALVALDLDDITEAWKQFRSIRQDVVRVHDCFHAEDDKPDTPDTFRSHVECLVEAWNTLNGAFRVAFILAAGDDAASDDVKQASKELLRHGDAQVHMMQMPFDPQTFFRMMRPPQQDETDD